MAKKHLQALVGISIICSFDSDETDGNVWCFSSFLNVNLNPKSHYLKGPVLSVSSQNLNLKVTLQFSLRSCRRYTAVNVFNPGIRDEMKVIQEKKSFSVFSLRDVECLLSARLYLSRFVKSGCSVIKERIKMRECILVKRERENIIYGEKVISKRSLNPWCNYPEFSFINVNWWHSPGPRPRNIRPPSRSYSSRLK